jgi:hypothetical protein
MKIILPEGFLILIPSVRMKNITAAGVWAHFGDFMVSGRMFCIVPTNAQQKKNLFLHGNAALKEVLPHDCFCILSLCLVTLSCFCILSQHLVCVS